MVNLSFLISELEKISNKLGVKTVESLPDIEPLFVSGTIPELIKKGKIQKVAENEFLRSIHGEILFLYIPDHSYIMHPERTVPNIPMNRNKVHLCYCETLQSMERMGRSHRYVATNQNTGKFPIKYNDEEKEHDEDLNVCRYCMKLVNSDDFGTYDDFNFKEFSKHYNYAVPWFEGIPKTLYGVDYPFNWKEISYKIRAERGWKCEKCGLDCSKHQYMLDLHHINGIKSDCSYSNLIALCRNCHKKEPNHSHMLDCFPK